MRDLLSSTKQPRLNIGPGMAKLEVILPDVDIKIVLDITHKALKRFIGKRNIHPVNAVAEYLPFRDKSIPTVSTQSTFQVMANQEAFLTELARILEDDGFFCITIEWRTWYQPEKQSFNVDDLEPLYEYLNGIGLTVTETRHLDYDGEWYEEKDKGFSIWITGKKIHRDKCYID